MSLKKGVFPCVLVMAITLIVAGSVQAAITLKVWDQWTGTADKQAVDMMDANFEKMHPDVKIERSAMPAATIADKIRPALLSGTGPDVIYPEVGITFLGPLAKAGLVMDLTEVWEKRGWNQKLVEGAKAIPTFGGRTFGVGHEIEYVPIYYNKNIFNKLGVTPPKSISELEDICEKALAAGYIPIAWSARDWWTKTNLATAILWSYLGKEKAEEAMFRGGSWDMPEVREALQKAFVEWPKRNFYPPNFVALGYDEGNMFFYQQKAVMHPEGNWMIGGYVENVKDFEIGVFLWPRPKEGEPSCTIFFCGSGYVISNSTKYPELAVDYVDYLMASKEAAKLWYEVAATIPPLKLSEEDIAEWNIHYLVKEATKALSSEEIQFVPGLSMGTPAEAFEFLKTGVAEILTGQITVDEFVKEWNKLWQKGREEGLTYDTFKLE